MKVKDLDTKESRRAEAVQIDLEIFSDVYKDLYGVRPRDSYAIFRELSEKDRKASIHALMAALSEIAEDPKRER